VIDEASIAGLTFRHEPLPGAQPGEVAGHLHPAAKVTSGRATIRRRCFVTDGTRLVLPAFGAFTGGLNILDEAFAPLFGGPAAGRRAGVPSGARGGLEVAAPGLGRPAAPSRMTSGHGQGRSRTDPMRRKRE
jgi:hypothetical protein